jgi:hypothetical protein
MCYSQEEHYGADQGANQQLKMLSHMALRWQEEIDGDGQGLPHEGTVVQVGPTTPKDQHEQAWLRWLGQPDEEVEEEA